MYTQHFANGTHRGGTRPLPPRVVVLHATGGTDSLAWLSTDPASAVSAHLLISKDGTVYRIVEDAGVAWHAGVSSWSRYGSAGFPSVNDVSLGIELENLNSGTDPYPYAQLYAAAAAIVRWYGQYGYMPIVSHAQVAPGRKNDPMGFPWENFGQLIKDLMLSGVP